MPSLLELDLPILPPLNKDTVPALTAFLVVVLMPGKKDDQILQGWVPQGWLPRIFLSMLLGGGVISSMTNGDPLFYGPTFLQGLELWDTLSGILIAIMTLLPFFLGRKLLARPEQQRHLLIALVSAGCAYSLLALYEVRMSPQLNKMIYGFFPHSFAQHIRQGGFRPLVFLDHGLWLAIFFTMSILSAFGLTRLRLPGRHWGHTYFWLGVWLFLTLILSKSLGALVITIVLLPMILFLGVRVQLIVATLLSITVLIYPMMRGADLVPVEKILELAEKASPERSQSLNFRITNENELLEKAKERPVFGWGGWGRNLVYNETGDSISTTDGYWIIIFGIGGWVRYLAEFSLLCLPPVLALLRQRRSPIGPESVVLIFVLVANVVDLLPNSGINPLTWMIAGALWGRFELAELPHRKTRSAVAPFSRSRISPERIHGRHRHTRRSKLADQSQTGKV